MAEVFAIQSKEILRKRVKGQFFSKEFSGMGHAEVLSQYPNQISKILIEYMQGQKS